jgi:hypothetical protein
LIDPGGPHFRLKSACRVRERQTCLVLTAQVSPQSS